MKRLTGVFQATLLFGLLGCGNTGDPDRFLIYDIDRSSGGYSLTESSISTLRDVRRGRGEIARLRGGGEINAVSGTPTTEKEWREAITIVGAGTPDIRYVLRDDGVAMATDFDSAMMLTLYHHLERAAEHFDAAGVSHATVRALPVYFSASYQASLLLPIPLLTDNAAYVMTLDAFLIPPRLVLKDVPLFANRGVVVHEYSHAVFNRLVHQDRRVPRYLLESWSDPVINELRSLDEGVADVFAALAVGDPAYLLPSIPNPEDYDIDRDLSVERYYDDALRGEVISASVTGYDPYRLGSVVASAIWALRPSVDDATLAQAVATALRDIADPAPEFSVSQFLDRLVLALPAAARANACQLFHARFSAVEGGLTCTLP